MKKLICVLILLCMLFGINIVQVFAEQNTIIWQNMKLTQSKYNEIDFDKSGDVTFHTEYNTYNKDVKENPCHPPSSDRWNDSSAR